MSVPEPAPEAAARRYNRNTILILVGLFAAGVLAALAILVFAGDSRGGVNAAERQEITGARDRIEGACESRTRQLTVRRRREIASDVAYLVQRRRAHPNAEFSEDPGLGGERDELVGVADILHSLVRTARGTRCQALLRPAERELRR